MRQAGLVLAGAVAMAALGGTAAKADVTLLNKAGMSVWVTIYGSIGDQIYRGCLANEANRTVNFAWDSDGATGTIVYVRGELKQRADCTGATISDTGRGSPISVTRSMVKTFSFLNRLRVG